MMGSSSGLIFTAFLTKPAANWMLEHNVKDLTIVVRGRVSDFRAGALDLGALRLLVEQGYFVFFHFDLHAKIYQFGEQILLGSANLTANGMNLLEQGGNIEFSNLLPASDYNLSVLKRIIVRSLPVNFEKLQLIGDFLSHQKGKPETETNEWPDTIFPANKENILWLQDLPSENFATSVTESYDVWGNIARSFKSGKVILARQLFSQTSVAVWMKNCVSAAGDRGASFGMISSKLHSALEDDPSPYRKQIKNYQKNLYSFIEILDDQFVIDRPNHSQVLKLKG